jgi:hypothetical protein
MVFNDAINEQGLVQEIDSICGSDFNSYPIKAKTRRINMALDRYFTLAMQSDGRWEIDDSTYTDNPIATHDLKIGVGEYPFPEDLLDIFRVEVVDDSGFWRELKTIDQVDLKGTALEEYRKTDGLPELYDKKYSSLWIYPKPDVETEDGLKIYYNRKFKHFVGTETNAKIGVPEIFHSYIARYASLPFLVEKTKANKNDIATLIEEDEKQIKTFYSRRGRDEKQRVLSINNNFI